MIIDHSSIDSLQSRIADAQRQYREEQAAKYVQVSPRFCEVSDVELIALILTIKHMHPKFVDALLTTASCEIADVSYEVTPRASQFDIDRIVEMTNTIIKEWRKSGV